MLQFFKCTVRFWHKVIKHFLEEDCLTHAGALSYTTLLSIVPLMVVSLGIVSAFPVFQTIAGKIQTLVFEHFVAASADVIQEYIKAFAQKAAGLSITSLFFLLVTAVMMIFTMETSFNRIWKVKVRRHGVTAFLMYWAMLTLLPILVGVGVAITRYIISLPYISGAAQTLESQHSMLFLLPMLITWVSFTLLYIALPNCKVKLKDGLFGAFVATILFEIAKHIFSAYIVAFPTYFLIYGALATIPIFFIWIYVSWVIILLGAVVSFLMNS